MLDPTPFRRAPILSAIQAASREADYLMSILGAPLPHGASVREAIERLPDLGMEGIVAVAPEAEALDALGQITGRIPAVAIAAAPQDAVSTVTGDHYAGAAAATFHLLALGHATVFHVAGPFARYDCALARGGWRDTLLAAGAEIPAPLIGDGTPACGYQLGCRLAVRPDVGAILVAGDAMALGVLHALSELGRRVPEEVSVIGLDGGPQGEFFTPPLSTVRQDLAEMGRRSFEVLRREIENGPQPRIHEVLPTELILRASTLHR